MKQYKLSKDELTLRVNKSPFIIRSIFFTTAFLFFLLPIGGLIASMVMGNGFHIGFLIGLGLFGLMGFYLLRIALWNTYGSETIQLQEGKIMYQANYGWFKDFIKTIEINDISFTPKQIGYVEDNVGVLIIASENSFIECATKIPMEELYELITILSSKQNTV